MGIVLIKERTLGILERSEEKDKQVGIYTVKEKLLITRGMREYQIKAIAWGGNPYVFNFFKHDLEQYHSFSKAWGSLLASINNTMLMDFEMMLIVERSDRNFKLPSVIEAFCRPNLYKPNTMEPTLRDCGDTRDSHYISCNGKEVPRRVPLKDFKFLESILV